MKIVVRLLTGVLLAAGVGAAANAQAATVPAAQRAATPSRLQLAVTYTAGEANLSSGQNHFWLQGGSAELSARIWRGLGETANITGLHVADSGDGVPVNLVITTFGPRYTWDVHPESRHPVHIFGEGLVGIANGFSGLYPYPGAASTSANDLAVQAGGGIDYSLNRRFSLRLIQAEWLRTQLPNAATNVQNSLLLGAGIVFQIK